MGARMDRNGELESGDETLTSGEFVDTYEFEGSPGQHVAIDLRSSAFDTYLILKDPAGEQTENDDADDGGVGHSSIEADLDRGRHVSGAGDELRDRRERRLCADDRPDRPRRAELELARDRDVTTLDRRRPRVAASSKTATRRSKPASTTTLTCSTATKARPFRIELSSSEFDTYLGFVTPSGEEIANDDFEGDTDRSVIELTLPEAGRYRVQATSYGAAETGRYRLALTTSAADSARRAPLAGPRLRPVRRHQRLPRRRARILQYTAEDATRIRDALIGGGGMRAAGCHHVRR